jgi:hypothetical protein
MQVFINERVKIILDEKNIEFTNRRENIMRIQGLQIDNNVFDLDTLRKYLEEKLIAQKDKEINQFISDNLTDNKIFTKLYNKSLLICGNTKMKSFYSYLNFQDIFKGIIYLDLNDTIEYNILNNTFKCKKTDKKLYEVLHEHQAIYQLLLEAQIKNKIALDSFVEAKKAYEFLENKKTIRAFYDNKEITLKDYNVRYGRMFDIDDNLNLHLTLEDSFNTSQITLKHGHKQVTIKLGGGLK